eukprot:9320489-Ditylum_brightwellii.AAC.1
MHRVQQLKGGGSWVVNNRLAGAVWDTDSLRLLKGVEKKTAKVLEKELNVKTVSKFKQWHTPKNVKQFWKERRKFLQRSSNLYLMLPL